MPTVWNAADGRLWAAEFASGEELFRCMTGTWLAQQPAIDQVTRSAVIGAIRSNAPVIRAGVGPQTIVLTASAARSNATQFAGEMNTYSDPLDVVLADDYPAYAKRRASQPQASAATLGGTKHGAAGEWTVDPGNGQPNPELTPIAAAIGVIALVAIVVVLFLYGDVVLGIWSTILRLFLIGSVIWLFVKAWRWMQG